MKTNFLTCLLLGFVLLFAKHITAQTLPAGQVARFGIDGDLYSDERLNGTFTAAGSHDWFKKTGGSGIGLIDTADHAALRSQLASGVNIAFSRRMPYMRYSVQDDILMLDACYARDYMSNDKTSFSGNGTKNTTSPLQWGTAPNGANVSDKTDILDTYVSMRRSGNVISGAGAGNLVATMGLTTLATSGDHYADFEFYRERVNYNTVTGKFENTGPVASGGHSAWTFNTDGSIQNWGDMTISFSFNGSSVSDIKILIWVSKLTTETVDPKTFDFISGEFYASTTASAYGYVAIRPNGAGQLAALGAVNTATTKAPLWGTNSKDLGSNSNSYFVEQYSVGQFAEASVDLTVLGVDPASFMGMNACNPPFTRFMTKSRSSSSFSSSLSDFNGPFEFLDVPSVPAAVTNPAPLTCVTDNVQLSPASYIDGAYYSWHTDNGKIVGSNPDSSLITVIKPGTYYLTAAITKGCVVNVDSVVVVEDKLPPVATAGVSDMVFPGTTVTLYGGDTTASNYATPFGGSQGLLWKWKGPLSFTSTEQNPLTGNPGEYTLVVTEKRNGCTDTALVYVIPYPTLPVSFQSVTVQEQQDRRALLWQVVDATAVHVFNVEKSINGRSFSAYATVFATPANTLYLVPGLQREEGYYRVKAIGYNGKEVYSPVVKTKASMEPSVFGVINKGNHEFALSYQGNGREQVAISLLSQMGQVLWSTQREAKTGSNRWDLVAPPQLASGIYFLHLRDGRTASTLRVHL